MRRSAGRLERAPVAAGAAGAARTVQGERDAGRGTVLVAAAFVLAAGATVGLAAGGSAAARLGLLVALAAVAGVRGIRTP